MSRRLIIYEDNKVVKTNENYMTTNYNIYMIYDGKIFNPPYFDMIILCKKNLIDTEKQMCWNMLNTNGKLVTYNNNLDFLNRYKNVDNVKKLSNKMVEITKSGLNIMNIIKYKYRFFDFGIIGTQKSGTTSLLLNLRNHKEVSLSKEEDHIFDLGLGKNRVMDSVKKLDNNKTVGFKNPGLLYLTHNYIHLQKFGPSIKLIILLRNPVNRAYSHWNMRYTNKLESYNTSFEDAIKEELKYRIGEIRSFNTSQYHFLQKGLYYEQLIELFKYFQRSNVLIIISEKMFEDNDKYYNMIYDFIGIRSQNIEKTKERIGVYKDKLGEAKYNELMEFFKKDITKLEELLGYKTGWN